MPVYAFRCRKCAHEFEVSLSMKDRENAAIVCPRCKSAECGQLFGGINIGPKSTVKGTPASSCSAGHGCAGCSGCRPH